MDSHWLKTKQTRYAAYVTLYIAIVLGSVAAANVLANRYNKSLDATSNKRYTLSDQTAKIVKGLQQDAKITYFDQTSRFPTAKDLLDRYANLSSRVKVEYVDPDKSPQLARAAGVANYGTTYVEIGANREEAKALTEEGITGAIIRDLKSGPRFICFVTGNGEHQIDDSERNGYSEFKDLLGRDNYEAKSVSLLEKAEVPSDCTVLVIGGPRTNYEQPAVDAIKKYVEEGGRALLMLDPPLKLGQLPIAENTLLASALQSWGVTADKVMILDLNPMGQLAGLGPQVALVTSYDAHAIVNAMKGTATGFPLARSLQIENTEKSSVEKLFSSSETSLATPDLSSPSLDPEDPRNIKGPLTLAAAGTYTTGRENSQGRFVTVGSSLWVANSFINFNGNSDLALNTINWLASDEDLISIRPKEQEDRKVTMTRTQLNLVRISSQFLLPGFMIVTGLMVWWRRR